jgi:Uma2 family endonuclease
MLKTENPISNLLRPWQPQSPEPTLLCPPRPVILDGIPQMYEDEEEGEMGEARLHTLAINILFNCFQVHLAPWRQYEVFENLNLYYDARNPNAYVSPDIMVAEPFLPMPENLPSYRIGETGKTPILTVEVLSPRTAQQRDLTDKLRILAQLGIPEYIIVDLLGIAAHGPLLIKRLKDDRTWSDEKDADGGVTSQLGFRIVLDADGQVRLLNTATGRPYLRPVESVLRFGEVKQNEEALRLQLEQSQKNEAALRLQLEQAQKNEVELRLQLEAELARLRAKPENAERSRNGHEGKPST